MMDPANRCFLVLFFKTRAPVDPVTFVRHICRDAVDHPERKRTRFAKRLSPMTLIDKASEEGLEKVAKEVLAERFHGNPREPRKVSLNRASLRAQMCVRMKERVLILSRLSLPFVQLFATTTFSSVILLFRKSRVL